MKLIEIISSIKNALETSHFSFTVTGAVLFGSQASGFPTKDSDIDLLVVAENIEIKRHHRKKEMISLKHALPVKPLDILLLTPNEVVSNFSNHNPLFLDIAEDGIIINDKDNFLNKLIRETRQYIIEKGIKRIKDGWQFPVAFRTATFLSQVSNQKFSQAMLKDGERDFLIGKHLIKDEFFDKAVYHFEQAVEKCIKSILIAFGTFQKTHFVGDILEEVIKKQSLPDVWKQNLIEIAQISAELEPEVSLTRYPGIIDNDLWLPYDEYGLEEAEESLLKAETVLTMTRDFNIYWFSKNVNK